MQIELLKLTLQNLDLGHLLPSSFFLPPGLPAFPYCDDPNGKERSFIRETRRSQRRTSQKINRRRSLCGQDSLIDLQVKVLATFEDKWFLEFHSVIEACNQALQDLCSAYIVQPLFRQHHLFIAKTGGVHVLYTVLVGTRDLGTL